MLLVEQHLRLDSSKLLERFESLTARCTSEDGEVFFTQGRPSSRTVVEQPSIPAKLIVIESALPANNVVSQVVASTTAAGGEVQNEEAAGFALTVVEDVKPYQPDYLEVGRNRTESGKL
jgi:hypothetical protein